MYSREKGKKTKGKKESNSVNVYLHEPEVRAFDVGHGARVLFERLGDSEHQRPVANFAVVARARRSSLEKQKNEAQKRTKQQAAAAAAAAAASVRVQRFYEVFRNLPVLRVVGARGDVVQPTN